MNTMIALIMALGLLRAYLSLRSGILKRRRIAQAQLRVTPHARRPLSTTDERSSR